MDQWIKARKEMGLVYDLEAGVRNKTVARRYEHYLHRVYRFADGVSIFCHGLNNIPIIYHRLLKCANEGIRGNLANHMMLPDHSGPTNGLSSLLPRPVDIKSQKELNALPEKGRNLTTFPYLSFTFIRDPYARFVSGITECASRSYKKPQWIQADVVTKYINDILDFKRPLKQIEHAYPMSGTFYSFKPPDFLGHLESFEQDWAKVKLMYSLPLVAAFDKTLDSKRTTGGKDPQNVRKAFAQLPDNVVRAVCHMLMSDYICFPEYPLPPQCQGLEPDRKEGMDRFDANITAPKPIWIKSDIY